MAVSKRLRFEILRRDNHTCYYCGRKAPEVEITIDHVLPQALGGTDEASNLVACCRECNGGKTSIAPDSPLVARVDEDAIRWSAAMQAAIVKAEADHEALAEYRVQFLEAWNGYKQPAELDENWRVSIETFRTRGLPIEMLIEAAHRAMAKANIGLGTKFRYMCGIAWSQITEIEKNARKIFVAESGEEDGDEEEQRPTLKDEVLPLIGQYDYEVQLERARAYYDDEEDERSEDEIEQDAITSALWNIYTERSGLVRSISSLLRVTIPSDELSDAMGDAREQLRVRHEERSEVSFEVSNAALWRDIADLILDRRAVKHIAALPVEEQEEWMRYATTLKFGNGWGWGQDTPTTEQLLRNAGRLAMEIAMGWRYHRTCFYTGQHIERCPNPPTARMGIAGCTECGHDPLAAEVGILVCDSHLERAVDGGVSDSAGHRLAVTDFIVLPPEEEAPF